MTSSWLNPITQWPWLWYLPLSCAMDVILTPIMCHGCDTYPYHVPWLWYLPLSCAMVVILTPIMCHGCDTYPYHVPWLWYLPLSCAMVVILTPIMCHGCDTYPYHVPWLWYLPLSCAMVVILTLIMCHGCDTYPYHVPWLWYLPLSCAMVVILTPIMCHGCDTYPYHVPWLWYLPLSCAMVVILTPIMCHGCDTYPYHVPWLWYLPLSCAMVVILTPIMCHGCDTYPYHVPWLWYLPYYVLFLGRKLWRQFGAKAANPLPQKEIDDCPESSHYEHNSIVKHAPVCTWWRHQMETFSASLALCGGNSPVTRVNSPHKGQWCGALMFSCICTWIKGSLNNRETGDLRRHGTHCDVIVMEKKYPHCKHYYWTARERPASNLKTNKIWNTYTYTYTSIWIHQYSTRQCPNHVKTT